MPTPFLVDAGTRAVVFDKIRGIQQVPVGEGTHFRIPFLQVLRQGIQIGAVHDMFFFGILYRRSQLSWTFGLGQEQSIL
jgi:hypothetical protein